MQKVSRSFVLFIFCVLHTNLLFAESEDVIIIGADHNPPFRVLQDGKYNGIYGEMIKEIVKDMNLEVRLKEVPFKRSINQLKSGEIDIFLALLKRPEREIFLYYCKPYIKNRTDRAFYLRKGQGKRIQSYNDLYGLQIGILRGVRLIPQFDNDSKLIKQSVATHEQNLKKLIAGRIDTFVHTEIAIDYQIKTSGYQGKVEKSPFKFTEEQPTYFVISRKSKYMNRIHEFEINLQRVFNEDLFWKLVEKWTK